MSQEPWPLPLPHPIQNSSLAQNVRNVLPCFEMLGNVITSKCKVSPDSARVAHVPSDLAPVFVSGLALPKDTSI